MRLLVTGGLGFIGSNFIRLMAKDHEIVNVDNLSYGSSESNLRDLAAGNCRYCFVRGDICDPALMSKLIGETDTVINFAAETHVDRSISDPWPFYRTNVGGVLTILEAMRKSDRDVRLLQVGTDESYGDTPEGSFVEEDRLRPSSPYSASKASADLFIMAYHRTYGLDTCITRCTNNFGPYQFPEKLIPKAIIRAHRNLAIPVYGTGRNVRDWLFVQDHCNALRLVLEKGHPGEIYNISSGNELDNLSVIGKILALMGKSSSLIKFVDDRPGHDARYSLASLKLGELGWTPKFSFEDALAYTVKWYLSNEWWWAPLASSSVLCEEPWKLKW